MSFDSLFEIKKHFDNLSPFEQWNWVISNITQLKFVITLDTDNTTILFDKDIDANYILEMKTDCGSRIGVYHLLESVGANVEYS
jgi:hypothetical protein